MRQAVQLQLQALNRRFYRTMAQPFAQSRSSPAPGFAALLDWAPAGPISLLDVGCGEGRLGRFLAGRLALTRYLGVDQDLLLLDMARAGMPPDVDAQLVPRNLAQPGALAGLSPATLVACLATLHHVPGRAARLQLLRAMASRLLPGGRIWLSSWQFLDSARQQRKLVDWSSVNLRADDVEPGDYLLRWQRGGQGVRYVASLDEPELFLLAREAQLVVRGRFRSDGREGNLNLYLVLERS